MYCIQCGAALETAPPTQCVSCGVRLWRNAKPCGALLVVEDGKLLLVRRAVEPWRGRWDIPGGFCEYGEHPIAAAVRETQEETGLSVRATGYLGMWHTRNMSTRCRRRSRCVPSTTGNSQVPPERTRTVRSAKSVGLAKTISPMRLHSPSSKYPR